MVKAMRDPDYQQGQHIHFPRSNKVPEKVTNEISRYIEMLSLLDAILTDREIRMKIIERFGLTIDESTVSTERQILGFHFRPPMAEQNLT
jgi:transposase